MKKDLEYYFGPAALAMKVMLLLMCIHINITRSKLHLRICSQFNVAECPINKLVLSKCTLHFCWIVFMEKF